MVVKVENSTRLFYESREKLVNILKEEFTKRGLNTSMLDNPEFVKELGKCIRVYELPIK